MSEHSDDFTPNRYLVGSSFVFGGREFEVLILHDGFSYWFDPFAKNEALKANPDLVVMAAISDGEQRKFLSEIHDEWTVKAPVPEADLREICEDLSARYWADCTNDFDLDRRLDEILEPIFWSQVNPQLSVPVKKP